jgi:hypothetical protein
MHDVGFRASSTAGPLQKAITAECHSSAKWGEKTSSNLSRNPFALWISCKLSARARAYICTYYQLAKTAEAGVSGGSNTTNSVVTEHQPLLYKEIERLMKDFKVHRCALDFDRGFVNAELKCVADN